jgi:hypothetical protein
MVLLNVAASIPGSPHRVYWVGAYRAIALWFARRQVNEAAFDPAD